VRKTGAASEHLSWLTWTIDPRTENPVTDRNNLDLRPHSRCSLAPEKILKSQKSTQDVTGKLRCHRRD